jgi:hypothetical protein
LELHSDIYSKCNFDNAWNSDAVPELYVYASFDGNSQLDGLGLSNTVSNLYSILLLLYTTYSDSHSYPLVESI